MHNILEGDDFGIIEMSETINSFEQPPTHFSSMNLFQERNLRTASVGIERKNSKISVIPTAARGTMPETNSQQKRDIIQLGIPHLPHNDGLQAADVQGLRSFGGDPNEEGLEAVGQVLDEKLQEMSNNHAMTWEFHQAGALQGNIKDADGSSSVLNLFTAFNVTRQTVTWDKSNTTSGLKEMCIDLRRKTQRALKNVPMARIKVELGEEFWTEVITSAEVRDAYNRWMDNQMARDSNDDPFTYSKVDFYELMGHVNGVPIVPDAEGFSFPTSQAPLYRRFNAPGTFLESVNTPALRMYAKQAINKFGTGWDIHTQSSPLFICERPEVLVQVLKSA